MMQLLNSIKPYKTHDFFQKMNIPNKQTPFLLIDKDKIVNNLNQIKKSLSGFEIYYAVKSNPAEGVITTLKEAGSRFEIASIYELKLLNRLGVKPKDVIYSTPVKPPDHIKKAHQLGVYRFSFDSEDELKKIAKNAPNSSVILRLKVNDERSRIPLSDKYGAPYYKVTELMKSAVSLGLVPYGITFHVGSQSSDKEAWGNSIYICKAIIHKLEQENIRIQAVNIGGGFPVSYQNNIPDIEEIGGFISSATKTLPYKVKLIAEPGRYLIGDAGTMVTTVIGIEKRQNKTWLYTDISAFHGLMETMPCQGNITYDIEVIKKKKSDKKIGSQYYMITGPTCDSMDTWARNVRLPKAIQVGDRLAIINTGAYTISFASSYNGFPPPKVYYV